MSILDKSQFRPYITQASRILVLLLAATTVAAHAYPETRRPLTTFSSQYADHTTNVKRAPQPPQVPDPAQLPQGVLDYRLNCVRIWIEQSTSLPLADVQLGSWQEWAVQELALSVIRNGGYATSNVQNVFPHTRRNPGQPISVVTVAPDRAFIILKTYQYNTWRGRQFITYYFHMLDGARDVFRNNRIQAHWRLEHGEFCCYVVGVANIYSIREGLADSGHPELRDGPGILKVLRASYTQYVHVLLPGHPSRTDLGWVISYRRVRCRYETSGSGMAEHSQTAIMPTSVPAAPLWSWPHETENRTRRPRSGATTSITRS